MIVTLTANPALDRTIALAAPLRPGEVQAALSSREDAGGKGLNVARVVAAAGGSTLAVLPLDPADPFGATVHQTGLPVRAVPVAGAARANLTVTDPGGTTTKLNLGGAVRSDADGDALRQAVVTACAGADWLVLAGSLPPGLPDDYYVSVIRAVRAHWGAAAPKIAVDTSGPALDAVVAAGAPDLIKPNDEELAALTGEPIDLSRDGIDAVRRAAANLVADRIGSALVTLGAAGAVLVDRDGAWHGTPPPIRVRSTVGAGDSSLAGFLLARTAGAAPEECVRLGIRYGSAAAALPGTQPPTPADLPTGDVPVTRLTA
ncbi:1-phosphofructokinase family hexose kinase [Microbacterium sp. W1N]|uniref:1-phosphofructokinase family hexose kinase n=1 Tax=Microbacterium festucae TaxID=2977531 RepID=UPI0021C22632|nr:1-phosphofructokinase family hexose kinase [Microbacterium festucae]MCT9820354.1 1-phosphofructokinase family hexose kinase [Microbacterium festucae]